MIERQHLRIIHYLYDHGTLTEAAEALHLTQSALSHAMKKLEHQAGISLWKKDGRRIQLTQAGIALYHLASRLLPQFEHTEKLLLQIATGKQGSLRIGMECHPCYQWLLKVVSPFLIAFPDVDVDVRQAFAFGGLHALHNYDIDLLLTPDPLFLKSVSYTPVFEYEQMLVLPASHKLASRGVISPADLNNETLITYPVEPSRLDIFSQFLTPAGGSVRRHKTIETTEMLLQMVAAGRGVTALPHWLIEESPLAQKLRCCRLGEHGIQKQLYLGTRAQDDLPSYLTAFIELAMSVGHKAPNL
ncbi:LysR family transcriptional regulator [Alteromonas sp. H39]|uniref:LysR family transcriptional regulator n=1 Tax=Alteromonas sp. H39 TaxID=3389876 RepID=UPI0039E184AC